MKKIYEVMDTADRAFIMHKGKLIFEISPDDRYYIEGKEIIFGAEESLIAYKIKSDEYFRFQAAYIEDGSTFDIIPLKNLCKLILTYNIGYNITKNIARYLQTTNKIYIKKEKRLSGAEMASKEYAMIYYDIVNSLKIIYEKLRIGWLKQVIDRYINSLVYKKGLAFKGSVSKSAFKLQNDKVHDFTFNLKVGSIICGENDEGREMFILNRGNLEVYIGGKKVADINKSGTVIGEMALLLGEKRTATIKTVTDCNITVVKPENLKEFACNNKDFFLNIAVNLSKRLEHNCNLVRETNDLLQENKSFKEPSPPKMRTNYKELLNLIRDLERYYFKYKNNWLSEILENSKGKINKTRNLFQSNNSFI